MQREGKSEIETWTVRWNRRWREKYGKCERNGDWEKTREKNIIRFDTIHTSNRWVILKISPRHKKATLGKKQHTHTLVSNASAEKKQKWKLTKWIEKKRTTQWQDPTNTYRKYAHGINKSPACWNSKQDDTHKNVCVWETEGERVNKRSDRIKPNQTIRNRWYDDNNSNPIQYAGRGIFGSKLLFVAISSIKQSHNITHTNIHPQAYEHMIFCLAPSVIIGSKTIPAFSLLFLSRHTK